ncbi:hypothetical protein MMC24_001227 [Lignoscripta atroalba]|nr:hypothetical protein [Lignoscripta atroalba]
MSNLSDRPPPSTAAIAIATAILAALGGYFIGQASSLGLFSGGKPGSKSKSSWPNSYDVTIHPDSSDEELMKGLRGGREEEEEDEDDDEEEQGELSSFEGNKEECKLVLVVRMDLGMGKGTVMNIFPCAWHHHGVDIIRQAKESFLVGKGKIAAQCSHATLACYKHFLTHAPNSPLLKRWEVLGQAKVALQVKNEEELETLQAQAVSLGLCARIIHDAGRTQIASGSATVLGIGPGPKSVVDRVTGSLKLL